MFATLLGPLPRPPLAPEADPVDVVRAAVAAQVEAGLEPVTDGRQPVTGGSVAAWRTTAEAAAPASAKQVLMGPWTTAGESGDAVTLAESLGAEVASLAAAGCPMVEIHEPAVAGRSFDEPERRAAVAAWRLLIGGAGDSVHLSLVFTGGDVTGFGRAIYDAPFASYAFDLRAGPDNWRVIADAPGDRGIVVGAMATAAGSDDGPELLVWAAHYAASIGGRGLDRVGLATAGSLADLPWDVALRKLRRLGEAARIAAHRSFAEIAPHIDPRAAGTRSAALGRYVPPRKRRS